jgi:hypothetical protein
LKLLLPLGQLISIGGLIVPWCQSMMRIERGLMSQTEQGTDQDNEKDLVFHLFESIKIE